MRIPSPLPPLSELMKLPPLQLREFISQSEPELFNRANYCLGIAEVAASHAFAQEPPDLAWAEIALDVYRKLAKRWPNNQDSFGISAMSIRIRLWKTHPPQPDTLIGGPGDIVEWFIDRLPMSLEEANAKLPIALTEANLSEIRQLRGIKNRLSVLSGLDQDSLLPDNSELREWVKIRNQLPENHRAPATANN